MGQYWKAVNLEKKEYLDPYALGAGAKLWEQLANPPGIGAALIILLACMPEKRGGGDLETNPVVGRWAGDRVTFVGDYSEAGDMLVERSGVPFNEIYEQCTEGGAFTDISPLVAPIIECELEGRFKGKDGWKEWVSKDRIPEVVAEILAPAT